MIRQARRGLFTRASNSLVPVAVVAATIGRGCQLLDLAQFRFLGGPQLRGLVSFNRNDNGAGGLCHDPVLVCPIHVSQPSRAVGLQGTAACIPAPFRHSCCRSSAAARRPHRFRRRRCEPCTGGRNRRSVMNRGCPAKFPRTAGPACRIDASGTPGGRLVDARPFRMHPISGGPMKNATSIGAFRQSTPTRQWLSEPPSDRGVRQAQRCIGRMFPSKPERLSI